MAKWPEREKYEEAPLTFLFEAPSTSVGTLYLHQSPGTWQGPGLPASCCYLAFSLSRAYYIYAFVFPIILKPALSMRLSRLRCH